MDVERLIDQLGRGKGILLTLPSGARLIEETMDALGELQAENKKLRERIMDAILEGYAKGLGEMSAALEQVKRERDAAIEQLHGICSACGNYSPYHNRGKCRFCIYEIAREPDAEANDNWKWRSPEE